MSDPAEKFRAAELCPLVVENPPQKRLEVQYEGHQLDFGNKLLPREVRFGPKIHFPDFDAEALYSLVMIDPDNLSRAKPTVAEWLHWLVVNIPASNMHEGILGGQQLMGYGSPAPQPRTGEHRYVFLLWEHAGKRVKYPTPQQRAKFSVKKFMEKTGLGDPIAGNYYVAHPEGE